MDKDRSRLNLEIIQKVDNTKFFKQQSKLMFNRIHKSYTNYDCYILKQSEVSMDKPIYMGFGLLELRKLLMYESYYDELEPYFGRENQILHYMDTDNFVLRVNTKDIIKDLKIINKIFDFKNLDEKHQLFSIKKSDG